MQNEFHLQLLFYFMLLVNFILIFFKVPVLERSSTYANFNLGRLKHPGDFVTQIFNGGWLHYHCEMFSLKLYGGNIIKIK